MSSLPPGPRSPAIVQALRFGRDPTGFLERCAQRFGDAFTLRLPNDPPRVVVSHPRDIKRIFALRHDAYRSDTQSIHLNLGAHSVLFSDGERHRRQRKLMAPALQGRRLAAYAEMMSALTLERLEGWPRGESFALHPHMQMISLDVFLRCVFGLEGAERQRQRQRVLAWLDGTMSPQMFATGMVLSANRLRALLDRSVAVARKPGGRPRLFGSVARAKAELLALLESEIRRCREQGTEHRDDVLSLLVDARYEDGEPMDDEDILDQLITLLVGGHETTANSLSWAVSLIVRHPSVLRQVHQELEAVFEGGPVDPTRAGELRYLDACIKESMRLRPIAPAVSRTLTQPLELAGRRVEPGTIVWASIYLTQRRADVWDQPAEFRPGRFEGRAATHTELFPFGGGARRCVGALFASFEMRIVLAELFARCELRLEGPPSRPMFAGITISPADGVPVTAVPRRR